MLEAPIPDNEEERLNSVKELNILDTPSEERFDRIARIAQKLFDVPISTITIIDSGREWFKSCHGLNTKEGERAISFCGHALLEKDLFIIPDTTKDSRFADNPMVIGEPYIKFYAGKAIMGPSGLSAGVFCIKDRKPRTLDDKDLQFLKDLAAIVENELNSEELSRALGHLKEKNAELERINEVMVARELKMIELKKELEELKKK
jgi:GAF domain-containing protein